MHRHRTTSADARPDDATTPASEPAPEPASEPTSAPAATSASTPASTPASIPAAETLDISLLSDAAETFAMLAAPTRLHLLWLLARGSKDVTTLAETVGISVATVSQHLAKMRLANLVTSRRQGKRQLYEVDDPHVITLVHQVLEHHADLRSHPPLPAAGSPGGQRRIE